MDPEKLLRISALRPATRMNPAGGPIVTALRAGAERLAEMVGADCRRTPLGQHLAVRHLFPEPKAGKIGPQALRLLAPSSTEAAADLHRWLFLDTETTGLAGGTGTYAFLVGIGWWNEDGFTVEQLFMRDHSEERSLLHHLRQATAERPVLVTFNGKSFDWPLLDTRFRMNRLGPAEAPRTHIDLLHLARHLWRYRLRSVALSELERHVLNLDRGYDIPSESIPQRYFNFLRGGPAEPVAEVFTHNRLDMVGMAFLAERMIHILEEPGLQCEATELYGMSRLLQRRGEGHLAGLYFERALAGGLSEQPGRAARRELALFAKRRGDFEQAIRLWEELVGDSSEGLEAYEELAKYYEHRARDCERAACFTRDALIGLRESHNSGRISSQQYRHRHAEFQHRLDRLTAKMPRK